MEGICQTLFSTTCEKICEVVVIGTGGVATVALAPAGMAILPFLGAAGLSWTGIGAVLGAGGTVGWLLSAICNQTGTH